MNSPNKSATISVADFLFLPFFQTPLIPNSRYKEYLPQDGHYVWQSTKRRHWIGPTKAEISLVWLIGRGNTNNTK